MKTRMEKYYDSENNNISLRQQKNEELYENINNYEINDDYKLDTNVAVLDNNAKNIDVEQIKKILDTRYNKTPQRRSIVIEPMEEETSDISFEETREYDINAILEKARSEKEDDYETERLKKVRDTQFDILKSLNLEEPMEEKVEDAEEENSELVDLINTITTNELLTKKEETEELDPLDILTDLKGSEDTVVVGAQALDEDASETKPIMSLTEADKAKEKLEEPQDLGNTLQFTQSDFDDFNDLKKEVRSSKAMIYTIIGIVGIILVVAVVILLKHFLNI